MDSVLTELQQQPGLTLVITHGGLIRAACALLIDLQPVTIQPPAPASLTIITFDDHPRLAVFNLTGDGRSLTIPD